MVVRRIYAQKNLAILVDDIKLKPSPADMTRLEGYILQSYK